MTKKKRGECCYDDKKHKDEEPGASRILAYDLEVSPLLGYAWKQWDTNLIKIEQQQIILCFSYTWLDPSSQDDEIDVKVLSLPSFPKTYQQNHLDDTEVVKALHSLLSQATHLCGWNQAAFDNKIATSRFLFHKLKPPPPTIQLDGLKLIRKIARFPSNRLDDVAKLLLGEGKMEHSGAELWFRCLSGNDKAAWKTLTEYCAKDTEITARIYQQIAPFNPTPPRTLYPIGCCPNCGSENKWRQGYRQTGMKTIKRQYQCRSCCSWWRE